LARASYSLKSGYLTIVAFKTYKECLRHVINMCMLDGSQRELGEVLENSNLGTNTHGRKYETKCDELV